MDWSEADFWSATLRSPADPAGAPRGLEDLLDVPIVSVSFTGTRRGASS